MGYLFKQNSHKRIFRLILASIFLIGYPAQRSLAESSPEKELLSEAIKTYSSIATQDDIKTKLSKQESTLKQIDKITQLYSGTNIGLELLTTGKFGKYNSEKIRSSYLEDLISFNLKTCESSPSYSCLGFVSLENARKACKNPKGFSDFITASNNFKNAYKVFKGQGDAKRYELGVLSGYTNCANNAGGSFEKDFINSKLIGVLLENGDESKAVGITQQMKTPLFKVLSAAYIRESQGKYDVPTFNKLIKKAKGLNDEIDRAAAVYILSIKAIEGGIDPFDGMLQMTGKLENVSLPSPSDIGMHNIDLKSCNTRQKYLSEIAMDYIMVAQTVEGGYLGAVKLAEKCSNYVVTPIEYFRYQGNNLKLANSIRDFMSEQRSSDLNVSINYFLKAIPKDVLLKYVNDKEQALASVKGMMGSSGLTNLNDNSPYVPYPFIPSSNYGQYSLYKLYVDTADVCKATKSLFQRLRGSEYETEAVDYFVSSPKIAQEKKYSCGDEDLDLLLN
tara:strand:- start:28 stop:1539 length:1512 start_codon:yes stop_codon:yes gene_type:complete